MNIQANAPSPLLPQSSVQIGGAYFWEPIIKQPLVMVLSKWMHSKAIFVKYHMHAFRGDNC